MKSFSQFMVDLNERYVTIGVNPETEHHREKFRRHIHDILRNSYKAIGGYGGLGHGSEEESKAIHNDISDAGMIKLVHRNGTPTAVALYKKQHGRKLIAIGTNGTDQGKKDFGRIAGEDHKLKRAWVEASGALEHVYKKIGYPQISNKRMPELTGKSDIEPVDDDEYQYTRSIGGHRHQKVGLGHPNEGKTK